MAACSSDGRNHTGDFPHDSRMIGGREITVETARSGLPTLRGRAGGREIWLHSRYDPREEARLWAAAVEAPQRGLLVVLGVGLGYHVEQLAERFPRARILAVEATRELCELARAARGEKLSAFGNVVVAGPDEAEGTLLRLVSLWKLQNVDFLIYRPVYEFFKAELEAVYNRLLRLYRTLHLDRATAISFGELWAFNLLRSFPVVARSPGVKNLYGPFTGRPGVIVAAGPSLDKNIHLLAEVKNKALILATGTALKAILRVGVEPDLVVTIDPTEANYRHFQGVRVPGAALVFEPRAHYRIAAEFAGPTFVGPADGCGWLNDVCGEDLGLLWSAGSVANVAFSVAYLMGLNPIIFIGQDLAYGDGCTHSRLLEHQEPVDWEKRDGFIPVEGNLGGIVYTKSTWLSFLEWFERVFSAIHDRTIINATEGGARIRGARVMTFRRAVDDYVAALSTCPFQEVIRDLYESHRRHGLTARRERLVHYLEGILRALRRARRCCAKGVTLADRLWARCRKGELDPPAQRLALQLDEVEERLERLKQKSSGAHIFFGQVDLEIGTVSGELKGELKDQVLTALQMAFLYYARQAEVLERVIPVAQEVLERLREERKVAEC